MWGFVLKLLAFAGLAGALYVQTIRLRASDASYVALQASVSAKTVEAELADRKRAEALTAAYTAITKEKTDELETKLDAARADAAAYARRLRAALAQGGRGASGMPALADTASSSAAAGEEAVVDDDARICAENTVKAEGWRSWWVEVSAMKLGSGQ